MLSPPHIHLLFSRLFYHKFYESVVSILVDFLLVISIGRGLIYTSVHFGKYLCIRAVIKVVATLRSHIIACHVSMKALVRHNGLWPILYNGCPFL